MRKSFIGLLFISFFVLPHIVHAGVPEAVSYLRNQSLDDWTAMALSAAGEQNMDATPLKTFSGSSALDYAKRILSLVALGKNPTNYTGTDLVTGLKGLAQGGQIGQSSWLNDDAWGIMGLRSAGVSESDEIVKNSVKFIVDNQNSDGGWSWGVGMGSDTNDTAAVLMALNEAGYTTSDAVVQKAVAYLAGGQNSDAGWAWQTACTPDETVWGMCSSDSSSTSWVVSALTKLNLNPAGWTKSGKTPQDFILSLQTDNGSFKWQPSDATGSQGMTAYVVVALVGKSYPVAHGSFLGGSSGRITPLADLIISVTPEAMEMITEQEAMSSVELVNAGPNIATDVALTVALPKGVSVVRADLTDGVFDNAANKWVLPRLNNYATTKLDLTLSADKSFSGKIDFSVTARELDNDVSNNSVSQTISVTAPSVDNGQAEEPESSGEVLGEQVASCELPQAAGKFEGSWRGRALMPTDGGVTWYFDPVSERKYCLSGAEAAHKALERFGLGISNADLARIPVAEGQPTSVDPGNIDKNLAGRLQGRIVLQVESLGEAWYVSFDGGKRYYLKDGPAALSILNKLALTVPNSALAVIPVWP